MKLSTLDILDKDLSYINKYYLGLAPEVRFRFLREEFLLDRTYWERHYNNLSHIKFDWKEFRYRDIKNLGELDRIINSDDTGIYMFVIKPEKVIYDMPKYVFYVGIAGERDSNRPLKTRLKDYFNLSQIKKRKKVHRMLCMYHQDVYVAYTTLKNDARKKINLENIEEDLHGYFYPICNERDFPVDLKNIRKAFK